MINVDKIKLGNQDVKKVYLGSTQIYPNVKPFHAKFDLSQGTSSTTLTLPFTTASDYENLTINWGDGVTTTGTNTHTYPSIGVYDVKVYGVVRGFRYNTANEPRKLVRIINWGEFVISQSGTFYGCTNLVIEDLETEVNVEANSLSSTFQACTKITSIPHLNTANVTNMSNMFRGCSSLREIPLLDTSSVTNMSYMFYSTAVKEIPLLDTSNVTNMSYMFYNGYLDKPIPALNTSKVTSMENMFGGCSNLPTIPELDTSNVTNMRKMFSYCRKLTTVPYLNTVKVYNMEFMFEGCDLLDVDLSDWCVPLVTYLPANFITSSPLMTAEKLPVWGTCPNGENLSP